MASITLTGADLDYWKEHSQLINDLATDDNSLKLTARMLFGELNKGVNDEFINEDWEFLKVLLKYTPWIPSGNVPNSKKEDFKEELNDTIDDIVRKVRKMTGRSYSKTRAVKVLDFLLYDFEKILSKTEKMPKSHRKAYEQSMRIERRNNFHANNNNNNHNNNNNGVSKKERKYPRANVRMNNNNNTRRVPHGKSKSKGKGTRKY